MTSPSRVLITGGAGFVGANVAHRCLSRGEHVTLLDNLSRDSVRHNAHWLRAIHGSSCELVIGDVRDAHVVAREVERAAWVHHFAAQVAVTTSLSDPRTDLDVNVGGTHNVLEAVRRSAHRPPILFTSTNKVYGALPDVLLARSGTRYAPVDHDVALRGISERRPLDFHSPYGCSKGAADQYVSDYARSFGLKTVVFRMSCIYGQRQLGSEDEGWVAHFLLRALREEPITIYGDGYQVRDVLFADDLVDAMDLVRVRIDSLAGETFNVGGGPESTLSLVELLDAITKLTGLRPRTAREAWRVGDQRYYVSDTEKLRRATGWRPKTSVEQGIAKLHRWLIEAERGRLGTTADGVQGAIGVPQ